MNPDSRGSDRLTDGQDKIRSNQLEARASLGQTMCVCSQSGSISKFCKSRDAMIFGYSSSHKTTQFIGALYSWNPMLQIVAA